MVEYQSLAGLFPERKLPTIVSDSMLVRELGSARGFNTSSIQDISEGRVVASEGVVLITCDPSLVPTRGALNNAFRHSAVLIVPLLSFSADESSIRYLDQTLFKIDFQACCQGNMEIVDKLERTQSPIIIRSGKYQLEVVLSLSLEIALPKLEPAILPGEWVSIGQFMEIGLVPNEGHTAFNVNGNVLCDGIAVAHHRHNLHLARPLASKAWEDLKRVRSSGGFPLSISVEDSRVKSIVTSRGDSILDSIEPLTDEVFRGMLVEVAFASTQAFHNPDWHINSQLNEGAGGFHMALGTGVHAAHIDFVSSKAQVCIV